MHGTFDTDVVDKDLTLFAKWNKHQPPLIQLNLIDEKERLNLKR